MLDEALTASASAHTAGLPDGSGKAPAAQRTSGPLGGVARRDRVHFIGQLCGPAAGSLGEVSFRQGLRPPGDPLAQELLVAGPGLLTEDLQVLVLEFSGGVSKR